MFRKYWLVGLLVGLVGIGGWQGPALAQAWQTNRMALAAMEVCTGQQGLSAMVEAPPFLQAGAARCVGEDEIAHERYLQALKTLMPLLDILHAANPSDIELAQLAVQTYPNRAEAYFWLAEAMLGGLHVWQVPVQALTKRADLLDLVAVYEKGVAFVPTNGEEWDNLGQLYEAAGEWEKAAHAFDLACHYVDHGKNGCINAGRIYMMHEMFEEAAVRYEKSLTQLPNYPVSLRGRADALLALGREGEAVPYLQALAEQGDADAQEQLQTLP